MESILSNLHTGILLLHTPSEKHTLVIPNFSVSIIASFPTPVKNTPHLIKIKNPVNGKIICRKLTKKNVGFPTYFFVSSIYDIIYLCQQKGGEDTNDM